MSKRLPRQIGLPDAEPTALQVQESDTTAAIPADSVLGMFERLAKDPTVDVDKLERLIGLQKDIMNVQAKSAFDQAFAEMQPELPAIRKNGTIKNKAGGVQSRFAKLEDVQTHIKPILHRFGFSLRHRTEWPSEKLIRVVGVLSHRSGHAESSTFEAPMDKSEYRSDVQSQGSTISYGRRYTTVDLLNLTLIGADNDGQALKEHERQTQHSTASGTISQPQALRLRTLARKAGRSDPEVDVFIAARYGVQAVEFLPKSDYDEACRFVEAPGRLRA